MSFHKYARVLAPSFLAIMATAGCAVDTGADSDPTGHSDEAITSVTGTRVLQIEGKCMDVPNSATANGTPVNIWTCNGGSNQAWVLGADGTIRPSYDTNLCLDLPNWQTGNGTKLDIWACNGGTNQKWTAGATGLVGYGGKCVDNPGWNTADGTTFDYWDCNRGTNQSFGYLVQRLGTKIDISIDSSVQGSATINLYSDGTVQLLPSATNSNQATGYDYQFACAVEDTHGVAYTLAYAGNVTNAPFNALQGTHVTNNPGWGQAKNGAVAQNWGSIVDGWNRGQVRCKMSDEATWGTTISNILGTIGSDLNTVLGWVEQYGPPVVSTVTLIAAAA